MCRDKEETTIAVIALSSIVAFVVYKGLFMMNKGRDSGRVMADVVKSSTMARAALWNKRPSPQAVVNISSVNEMDIFTQGTTKYNLNCQQIANASTLIGKVRSKPPGILCFCHPKRRLCYARLGWPSVPHSPPPPLSAMVACASTSSAGQKS